MIQTGLGGVVAPNYANDFDTELELNDLLYDNSFDLTENNKIDIQIFIISVIGSAILGAVITLIVVYIVNKKKNK